MAKRVFLIVLDSVGAGAAPDADRFGDSGCDTLGTCVRSGKLQVPTLAELGLYQIEGTSFQKPKEESIGCYMKLQEQSAGKDTTVGHWEIAGVISPKPLPVYPDGFPEEVIREFEKETGRGVLCNRPYSGTEVIRDYGREHLKTGKLIVYTSADSVFQIAAHEEKVPLEELYADCRIARKILTGDHGVGRVIARPFVGEYPDFTRTVNRHDFSVEPPKETILDALKQAGKSVIGVGKIYDIFAGRGITETFPNKGNTRNMEQTLELMDKEFEGLCFVNLVDFDMIYGHRNDIDGYVKALNEVDPKIRQLMGKMRREDVLILTADHGCDPGFPGTDHTREYVPCLCFGEHLKKGLDLGIRSGFSDIAATIADIFDIDFQGDGKSFWSDITENVDDSYRYLL
ncbi:phosphopentomutase [uncultured Merdimonas sp.]|uniref:phosphopentomutase n=1 Tax=uncultured Merdimonas sp. TaxID=2023269 RepID=UPI00320A5103